MKTAALSLDLIRTDGGTQMRAALDQDVYFDYRDKWLAGIEFDPVDVFHDGSTYWLADGFHRFYGAREAKRSSIPCHLYDGTQRDAILHATGANSAHGLRRTNADKQMAVRTLLKDEEWCKWSDVKIAERASVGHSFVSNLRKQLSTVEGSEVAKSAGLPRVGRDGKKRKPPRKRMKAPSNGKPLPIPDREAGEDETEPQHVANPSLPTDKSGNALPDRPELLKAFRSRDLFHSCEAARNVIYNNVYEAAALLPNGQGEQLKRLVDGHMKALFHTLAQHEPAYVCKTCNGGGCSKCCKRGYTCAK